MFLYCSPPCTLEEIWGVSGLLYVSFLWHHLSFLYLYGGVHICLYSSPLYYMIMPLKQLMKLNEARILLALKHPDPQLHYAAALAKNLGIEHATLIRMLQIMTFKGWIVMKKGNTNKKFYFLTEDADMNLAISIYQKAKRAQSSLRKQQQAMLQ